MSATADGLEESEAPGQRVTEVVAVDGQPDVRKVLVNGKQAGFIRKTSTGFWWGLGLDWPGYKTSITAAKRVIELYDEIQAELGKKK